MPFILAQFIISLPGAGVTLLILLLIPDKPIIFIVISTIVQAVLAIATAFLIGEQVQRWVGIKIA